MHDQKYTLEQLVAGYHALAEQIQRINIHTGLVKYHSKDEERHAIVKTWREGGERVGYRTVAAIFNVSWQKVRNVVHAWRRGELEWADLPVPAELRVGRKWDSSDRPKRRRRNRHPRNLDV